LLLQRIVFPPVPSREAKTSSPILKPPKSFFLSYEVSFITTRMTSRILMTLVLLMCPWLINNSLTSKWPLDFSIWLLDFYTTLFFIDEYANLHIPHVTFGLPHLTFCPFPFNNYIITFHMMWLDTLTHTDHYDDTSTSHNLTMMIWTSWWDGNANMYSLLLHLTFLMVDLIYASSSSRIHFILLLHPFDQYQNPLSHHAMYSFCLNPWSASCPHDNSIFFFISIGISLCFLLSIYFENYISMLGRYS